MTGHATLLSFNAIDAPQWTVWFSHWFAAGRPGYMIEYVLLIVFFCFFYTAIVFNPNEAADSLRAQGSFVPGYRPGPATAVYLGTVRNRLTAVGALYLAVVCVLPELARAEYAVPFGGTSILIVVCAIMDVVRQIHAQLRHPGGSSGPSRGWPPATGWVGPPDSDEVLAVSGHRRACPL